MTDIIENAKCTKFSDYSEIIKTVCKIVVYEDDSRKSICKCFFSRKSIFAHMWLVLRFASDWWTLLWGKKKKRGPQKKANGGKALIFD